MHTGISPLVLETNVQKRNHSNQQTCFHSTCTNGFVFFLLYIALIKQYYQQLYHIKRNKKKIETKWPKKLLSEPHQKNITARQYMGTVRGALCTVARFIFIFRSFSFVSVSVSFHFGCCFFFHFDSLMVRVFVSIGLLFVRNGWKRLLF